MRLSLLSLLGLASCRLDPEPPPLPPRAASPAASSSGLAPSIDLWPPPAQGRVEPVIHAQVALAPGQLVAPASVALLRGELSDAALRGLREGGLPASAQQRAVPIRVEIEPGALRVFPEAALQRGASYTLAVGPLALRRELLVADQGPPVLPRLWPPPGETAERGLSIFCADAPLLGPLSPVGFPFPGVEVRPGTPGKEQAACATVTAEIRGEGWPTPAALAGPAGLAALLSPAPLRRAPRPPQPGPTCADDEIAFGPGCVLVLDDRARWRLPAEPWLLLSGERPRVLGGAAVLRGLVPSSSARLEATALDLRGDLHHAEAEVTTLPAMAHVELSEALADPEDPEPAGEWVELHNDGAGAVSLEGWSLEDGQGLTPLPGATLKPGAHALLVNQGFTVAVPQGCAVVRLPKLGKSGLSNQGEPLTLRDAQGHPVSRLPASPRPRPGASLIRLYPGALDDDPATFALSTRPTPCRPNEP